MDFNLGILDDGRPCSIPTGTAATSSWNTSRTGPSSIGPSSIGDSLSRRTAVAKTRPSELKMDKPTAIPTSIEQPTPKSEDMTADITGTDPAKVRRALDALDPARVLRDLEKPPRPAWTEVLHDWVEVDMPRSVFEPWEVRQLERDSSVYWEYDAKRQRLGIRCVPTAIHEAPPNSFRAQAFQELLQLSRKSQDLFEVGSNTEFNGFDFPDYPISRKKEPDAFIMVWGGRFPLVVLESGFSERENSLVRDAQLWLYGSHAAVKFAVIIIITESEPICDNNQGPRRQLKDGEANELLSDGTKIPEDDNAEFEPSTSDQLQFAGKLRRLHEEKRLMRPLVGDIEANLRVYRKAREGDDEERIHRSNEFTEYPIFLNHDSPIYPDAGRNAIGMPWREVMGGQVESLGGRDKNKIFTLKPQKFKVHIQYAIRKTVERRSNERARVILEQRGRIEPEGNEPYEPEQSESSSQEEQRQSKRRKIE